MMCKVSLVYRSLVGLFEEPMDDKCADVGEQIGSCQGSALIF